MTRRGKADVEQDVEEARRIIGLDVPVFVAHRADTFPRGGTGECGYWLPKKWERTEPDEATLNDWEPGDALGAICGWTYDVLDIDPRNGGSDSFEALLHKLGDDLPLTYGSVSTPSGGWHSYIAALGIGKHTNFMRPDHTGLDLQGGRPNGESTGFVFLPPTEKRSKVDGRVRAYTWDEVLELPEPGDASGDGIANLILAGVNVSRKPGGPRKVSLSGDKMLTHSEIRHYLRHGIGETEAHDATLARCVWAWRIQRADREWAYARWRRIVGKTKLTDPHWKFTKRDFDRHWRGADAKRSEQEARERASLTVADLDAVAERAAGYLTADDLDDVAAGWL